MEVITTITARDYSNLKQVYSDKNIVNSTSGTEYIIGTAESTNITDINGEAIVEGITPLDGGTSALVWAAESKISGFGQRYYLREEHYAKTIKTIIETDQIITDINNISVKLSIDYDKYVRNEVLVSADNYNGDASVFYPLLYDPKENIDGYLKADDALPYVHTRALSKDLSSVFPANSIDTTYKQLDNGNYQIIIEHGINTWWGYHNSNINALGRSDTNVLLVARALNFTITANTINEKQVEFNYKRELSAFENTQGKNYAINGNEFLQTQLQTEIENKQSYILSQEIFSKFDTDRTILSFLLLNCEKYWIDGKQRYLQAEDLIYIQDENDQYIGTETTSEGEIPGIFEVIKTRPIWDGTLTMEVTCRRIDMRGYTVSIAYFGTPYYDDTIVYYSTNHGESWVRITSAGVLGTNIQYIMFRVHDPQSETRIVSETLGLDTYENGWDYGHNQTKDYKLTNDVTDIVIGFE